MDEGWETADEYLSGNVRSKLTLAEKYAEETPEIFRINAEELKKVQPKDLDASEIDVRIGTTSVSYTHLDVYKRQGYDRKTG